MAVITGNKCIILNATIQTLVNGIGGIMVSMLALSGEHRGFEPRSGQTIECKLVFVASPLSSKHH